MGFLPQNYEPPQTGLYLKLPVGKTKIRVLSPALVGNMFWTTLQGGERKPIRRRVTERIDSAELGMDSHGEREKVKHFWAFACWSYTSSSVLIAEITQASVRDGISALCQDEDWADPSGYDISITKAGAGLDTTYSVTPSNKSPTPAHILAAYQALNLNLDALFSGGDPFAGGAGQQQRGQVAPAAPPAPLSATEAARRAAFLAMKEYRMPDGTPEALKHAWLKLVAERFPGRPQNTIVAAEWQGLVATLKVYQGEGETPPIQDDDIPF